ncbi:hypothetical protein FCV25MIE_18514, partial [Fagus crenata]
ATSKGAQVSILARSISKLEEAKQAICLSTGWAVSSWLRAAVGLELGSELVVKGGVVGLKLGSELLVEGGTGGLLGLWVCDGGFV